MPVKISSESDLFFRGSYCSNGDPGRAGSSPRPSSGEARQESRSKSYSRCPLYVFHWSISSFEHLHRIERSSQNILESLFRNTKVIFNDRFVDSFQRP
ncbi:hypothetical protein J6590_027562 [Homalodisca vitripennis]|nr:hypothetical protein J6590_027562 [Homalodisca vitripennis]